MVYMVYGVAYSMVYMYMVYVCVGYQASRTALCLQNAGKQQQQQQQSYSLLLSLQINRLICANCGHDKAKGSSKMFD